MVILNLSSLLPTTQMSKEECHPPKAYFYCRYCHHKFVHHHHDKNMHKKTTILWQRNCFTSTFISTRQKMTKLTDQKHGISSIYLQHGRTCTHALGPISIRISTFRITIIIIAVIICPTWHRTHCRCKSKGLSLFHLSTRQLNGRRPRKHKRCLLGQLINVLSNYQPFDGALTNDNII